MFRWADYQIAPGHPGGEPHLFDHPFLQVNDYILRMMFAVKFWVSFTVHCY